MLGPTSTPSTGVPPSSTMIPPTDHPASSSAVKRAGIGRGATSDDQPAQYGPYPGVLMFTSRRVVSFGSPTTSRPSSSVEANAPYDPSLTNVPRRTQSAVGMGRVRSSTSAPGTGVPPGPTTRSSKSPPSRGRVSSSPGFGVGRSGADGRLAGFGEPTGGASAPARRWGTAATASRIVPHSDQAPSPSLVGRSASSNRRTRRKHEARESSPK